MIDTLLKSILAPITNLIASRINNKIQSIEYVNNMYNLLSSNYKSRLYIKNMLHVSHPVLFKDIYCPLSIAKLTTHEYDESSQIFNIKSVSTLMNQVNNIAIFGNAGSGKSTLVNYLYINSIEESYKFPILIYLRYLNLSTCSLVDYLKRQVLGYKNIECSDEIFSTLLENGCFLFFFDGYDEIISEKQYNIAIQIKDLVTNYPANKYVLTSRPLEHLYV